MLSTSLYVEKNTHLKHVGKENLLPGCAFVSKVTTLILWLFWKHNICTKENAAWQNLQLLTLVKTGKHYLLVESETSLLAEGATKLNVAKNEPLRLYNSLKL